MPVKAPAPGDLEPIERASRDELLALLGSGWPRWSPPSGVAVLSELWQ